MARCARELCPFWIAGPDAEAQQETEALCIERDGADFAPDGSLVNCGLFLPPSEQPAMPEPDPTRDVPEGDYDL